MISDSHGDLKRAHEALGAMGPVDLLVHAGDGWADAEALRAEGGVPVVAVAGNCDREAPAGLEEVLEAGGARILVVHGHTLGVQRGLGPLVRRARDVRAQVAVFGHTHLAGARQSRGVLLVNPGSLRFNPLGSSFAVLEVEDGRARAEIKRL